MNNISNSTQNKLPFEVLTALNTDFDCPSVEITPNLIRGLIELSFMYSLFFKGLSRNELNAFQSTLNISNNGYIIMVKLIPQDDTIPISEIIDDFNLYQMVKETLNEPNKCCIGPLIINRFGILITQDDTPSSSSLIQMHSFEIAYKIKAMVEAAFPCICKIGIGDIHDLINTNKSYIEAVHSLQMNHPSRINHIHDYEPYVTTVSKEYNLHEKCLLEAVRLHKISECTYHLTVLSDIMDKYDTESKRNHMMALLVVVSRSIISNIPYGIGYTELLALAKEISVVPEKDLTAWFYQKFNAITNIVRTQADTDYTNHIVITTREYLETHYAENITLEEVAQQVNISPQYFSKVIKKHTGFNFIDWLSVIRIGKAKDLLQNPETTVKEVCFLVGYKDPNYFSRIFKRRIGITPTEYQKLLLSALSED